MGRAAVVWTWAIVCACAGHSASPTRESRLGPQDRQEPIVDAAVPPADSPSAAPLPRAGKSLGEDHYLSSHFGECPTSMPVFDDVVKKPPASPPKTTAKGCVNGPTDRYAAALEAAARKEHDKALAGMGAVLVERPGTFVPNNKGEERPEGAEFEANGLRYVAVARGNAGAPIQLAKIGTTLHLVIDLPRTYLVRMKSCGANTCTYGSGAMARDTSVPLAVKLEPGESVGEPMTLHYDQFFLDLDPIKYVDCGPPPP